MIPDAKRKCHCTGFTKSCKSLVTSGACQGRWVLLQGRSPNTGEEINRWDCVDNFTHLLLLENSQQQRQTGAAVESFRNELVQAQKMQGAALAGMVALFEQRDGATLASPTQAVRRLIANGEGREALEQARGLATAETT